MDYNKLQSIAAERITAYGGWMIIGCFTAGTYDATTDVRTTTRTDYDIKGVFRDYNERDIDGSLIQVGDKLLMVQAEDLPYLDEEAKVEIVIDYLKDVDEYPILDAFGKIIYMTDSRALNPIGIKPLNPGGIPILYDIQVRG